MKSYYLTHSRGFFLKFGESYTHPEICKTLAESKKLSLYDAASFLLNIEEDGWKIKGEEALSQLIREVKGLREKVLDLNKQIISESLSFLQEGSSDPLSERYKKHREKIVKIEKEAKKLTDLADKKVEKILQTVQQEEE
jgi:3-methyladenine DNA glycosylase AlkD